ncbi:MAG TPA: beta-ketoacyl synthase N-terminal-like domain-containing protein [Steroidobacteraceae bacterium]|nr:beta-ketoacyl synthase N-terminal-like domain-containing protein [Steroidobacteraceae bacterium]
MRACYFSGAALHTSAGQDLPAHLQALERGPVGPEQVAVEYAQQTQWLPYKLLAGAPLVEQETRLNRVLDALIEQVFEHSGLSSQDKSRCGLFVGSSSFDIGGGEALYREALLHDAHALALEENSSLGNLAADTVQRFGLRGPDYSFNTACTASANALVYADGMIRNGQLEHALVIGVESFNAITALGFNGLQLLTRTGMRPFSPERNGLVLGEGCSVLLLGARPHGAHPWRLVSSANQCDTYGMSAANPDGSTVAWVIQRALERANLEPRDIVAIKTHGTASLSNDEAEAAGIRRVFATPPPLCALKPYLGHTLGACGLNELLLFRAAADQGFLIATPGIGVGDEKLGVTLNQAPCDLPRGHYLMNYFGFGGNNTALIVSNLAADAA